MRGRAAVVYYASSVDTIGRIPSQCYFTAAVIGQIFVDNRDFYTTSALDAAVNCRAMLCKRGLSRHAVFVCLSVCRSVHPSVCVSAMFVDLSKRIKKIFFHRQVATTFYFCAQMLWQYSDGNP